MMAPDPHRHRLPEPYWHLACPVCDVIAWPADGLLIDRARWLVQHMWEAHPFEDRILEIARGAELRAVAA